MVMIDFAPTHRSIQFPFTRCFHAVIRWHAARRAARARRDTLQSLLFAPEHRLRDLGISRDELIRAIEVAHK